MPLREHEAVAIRIVWFAAHHAGDRDQELDDRQRGADVPDAGPVGLFEHDAADVGG